MKTKKFLLILLTLLFAASSCNTAPNEDSGTDTFSISTEIEKVKESTTIRSPKVAEDDPVYQTYIHDEPLCESDFAATVHVTLDGIYSEGGLVLRAEDTGDGFYHGYYFCVKDKKCYLYSMDGTKSSGLRLNELGRKAIEDYRRSDALALRAEVSGNTCRFYYLNDDAEGVEPWPEFEFILADYRGCGIGMMDNGYGATFDDLVVEPYEAPEKAALTYTNPVYNATQAADPGILFHNGTYYVYSTSASIGYYVYTSTDLVHWENAGLCMEEAWGIDRGGYYWAPEVIEHEGTFYMVASVDEHLGIAIADSPLGPFEPCKSWLYDDAIDGHIYIDDDGTPYLYCVRWGSGREYGIYGVEMNADLTSVKAETEKLLLQPKESWEKASGSVTEGPFILKHNGVYYLTYSGTGYDVREYAVGYATSDSPLGDFERYEGNPILSYTSKRYGPGHHSFTTSPDGSELIIVYHIHASTSSVHPRALAIDRARFAPSTKEGEPDRLEIFGPTHTAQPVPKV